MQKRNLARPSVRGLLLAVGVAAILVPALVVAQSSTAGFVPGPLAAIVAERLALTAGQKSEARARLTAHRSEIEGAVAAVVAARRELFAAIHAAPADESAIRAAAATVADRELELALLRADVAAELKAVLTPEQRERLAVLRADGERLLDALLGRARERWQSFLAG